QRRVDPPPPPLIAVCDRHALNLDVRTKPLEGLRSDSVDIQQLLDRVEPPAKRRALLDDLQRHSRSYAGKSLEFSCASGVDIDRRGGNAYLRRMRAGPV